MMKQLSRPASPWRMVGAAAIVALGFSAVLAASLRKGNRPGVLVPRQTMVEWEGPRNRTGIGSAPANILFLLDNTGDERVRILGLESGCGCTKPVAEPESVGPGEIATVRVTATTIAVGVKEVPITVFTDSSHSPTIKLTLRLVGRQSPPFLFVARGDLTFRGTYDPGVERSLSVVTIEPRMEKTAPHVACNLPFLRVSLTTTLDVPYRADDVVQRHRRYLIGFREPPPRDAFFGEILVTDPWDSTNQLRVAVLGQFSSSRLRSFPSSVDFQEGKREEIRMVIVAERPVEKLEVFLEGNVNGRIEVVPEPVNRPERIHTLLIRHAGNSAVSSNSNDTRLRVRTLDGKQEVLVPLAFHARETLSP